MTLEELEKIITARAKASPDKSWTAKLMAKGPEKVAQKFGEEAVEAIIEATRNDKSALISEAADVLFHFTVMLQSRGVRISDVMAELEKRTAKSGLAEKASRKK